MDKRTGSTVGTPDFGIPIAHVNCGYLAIECKTTTGKITTEQFIASLQIGKQGGDYRVVRSFDDFLRILKGYGL
jgi:hypothetical protein